MATYSGNGIPGDLQDPNNWQGGVAPGVTGSGLITAYSGGAVTATTDVNNLMLLGAFTMTFAGTLDTVGIGTLCQGLMVCEEAVAIFAPTAVLNDGNALTVGINDSGTLLAQGSGSTHSVINSVTSQVGAQDDADGLITIDDAIWNNTGASVIGKYGTGTVDVIDHGLVNFGAGVAMATYAGSSGTLALASGGSVDIENTLQVGGASITTFGTACVSVATSSTLTVDHGLTIGASSTLTMAGGTVIDGVLGSSIKVLPSGVIAGFGTISIPGAATIANNGLIEATGGTLLIGDSVAGTGTLEIGTASDLAVTGGSIKQTTIDFIGQNATLTLAHGAAVSANVIGFAAGDIIAMANVNGAAYNASAGTLNLLENGIKVASLHLIGSYAGDTFAVHQTAAGGVVSVAHS